MSFNFSKISLDDLQQCNLRGWIPGPEEEATAFLKRIERLNHFFSYPPEQMDHFLTESDWSLAREKTKQIFDFSPDWMVAYYSNHNLTFFQGAATWIQEEEGVSIPFIQLRKQFATGSCLKIYRREEVLAHEAVHAARMQFHDPLFEEVFAYKTSPYIWRRLLGPLFQSPWESYLFVGLLFVPLAVEIASFFREWGEYLLIRYLPLVFLAYLLGRLLYLRLLLFLASKHLSIFLQNLEKKWAVLFRLTDKEIGKFALKSKRKRERFLQEQDSLRWQLIKKIYLKKI